MICAAALVAMKALLLTGCSDGKMLSDSALVIVLTNTPGETAEIKNKKTKRKYIRE